MKLYYSDLFMNIYEWETLENSYFYLYKIFDYNKFCKKYILNYFYHQGKNIKLFVANSNYNKNANYEIWDLEFIFLFYYFQIYEIHHLKVCLLFIKPCYNRLYLSIDQIDNIR